MADLMDKTTYRINQQKLFPRSIKQSRQQNRISGHKDIGRSTENL